LIEKLDGVENGEQPSTSERVASTLVVTKTTAKTKELGSSEKEKNTSAPFHPNQNLQNLKTFAAMGAVGDSSAVDEFRQMFPGLDSALARSLRVGEMLLKNEQAELDVVREKASEVQSRHHLMHRTDTPCVNEREACRLCYTTNAEDTLRCGAEVAAYDLCARAAQEAFVKRGVSVEV
jgi:hypothetical protein